MNYHYIASINFQCITSAFEPISEAQCVVAPEFSAQPGFCERVVRMHPRDF